MGVEIEGCVVRVWCKDVGELRVVPIVSESLLVSGIMLPSSTLLNA